MSTQFRRIVDSMVLRWENTRVARGWHPTTTERLRRSRPRMTNDSTSPPELTQAELHRLLHYDPLIGIFRWRRRPASMFATRRAHAMWNARYAGKEAGSWRRDHTSRGLRCSIAIRPKCYLAHRLAWFYMKGEWPFATSITVTAIAPTTALAISVWLQKRRIRETALSRRIIRAASRE